MKVIGGGAVMAKGDSDPRTLKSLHVQMWYALLLYHVAQGQKNQLNAAFDSDADKVGGTDIRIKRWERGAHLPNATTRARAEHLLPGVGAFLNHALWAALEAPEDPGASPFAGLGAASPSRPLYYPGVWVPLQPHLGKETRLRLLDALGPETPPAPGQYDLLTPEDAVSTALEWVDYLFGSLVWFDQSALASRDDSALQALWQARGAVEVLLAMPPFRPHADAFFAFLEEAYPLDWLVPMYCSAADRRSGQYLEMLEEGWARNRVTQNP